MINVYKDYNDFELLYLINENNEDAEKILYEKYKPIVKIKVSKYKNIAKNLGLDSNDLFQEGMIGLVEAIKVYKDNKLSTFSSFANVCIERQILSVLTSANRKKHSWLNQAFSLDEIIDEKGRTLSDVIEGSVDPSVQLDKEEEQHDLYEFIEKDFSEFEKSVFELKMLGLEYQEIAALLDKSYKSVDAALQRIRGKIRKVLKENTSLPR